MFFLLVAPALIAGGEADSPWQVAGPGYDWSFPRDLSAHPDYKTEWWYLTGHLKTSDQEDLAFQLTFFRIGVQPTSADSTASAWRAGDLIMAHAALTDVTTGTHIFSEVIWRATPFLGGFGAPGEATLAWCRAPAGTDDRWQLAYQDGAYHLRVDDQRQELHLDLVCTVTQNPVFHGDGGFSPKSNQGDVGSLYFSQTAMQVRGTVHRGTKELAVTGRSWLDREIFTSTLSPGQRGWDWLALQLDDGREVMLYRLLDQDGNEDFAMGTLVETDGTTTPLPAAAWELTPRETWTSPTTEAQYPVAWRLAIPAADIELDLKAILPDQENVSHRTGIHYWEGAVTATPPGGAQPVGRGFVELTGYGEGSRPPV